METMVNSSRAADNAPDVATDTLNSSEILIDSYKEKYYWWFLVQSTTLFVGGVVGLLLPFLMDDCAVVGVLLSVIFYSYAAAIAALRPCLSPLDNFLEFAQFLFLAVSFSADLLVLVLPEGGDLVELMALTNVLWFGILVTSIAGLVAGAVLLIADSIAARRVQAFANSQDSADVIPSASSEQTQSAAESIPWVKLLRPIVPLHGCIESSMPLHTDAPILDSAPPNQPQLCSDDITTFPSDDNVSILPNQTHHDHGGNPLSSCPLDSPPLCPPHSSGLFLPWPKNPTGSPEPPPDGSSVPSGIRQTPDSGYYALGTMSDSSYSAAFADNGDLCSRTLVAHVDELDYFASSD
eukprot:gene6781-1214_t